MFERITESPSLYRHLEEQSTLSLLEQINQEDQKVPLVIAGILPAIEATVEAIVRQIEKGGRLFYIGSGTSGRLGIVDASECPPTFGVPDEMVIGIIAGGDAAIRKAQEFAEDHPEQGWRDLEAFHIHSDDFLIGITASGTTPYVLGAVRKAKEQGIPTAGISCNPHSPLSSLVDFPIEAVVGPEFVTGSTRMKSGTAQKLILNMISTTVMIRIGRIKDNRMVDMQLTNHKLIQRGTQMVMDGSGLDEETSRELLLTHGSVRRALAHYFDNR